MSTLLDFIIDIEATPTSSISPITRTKNIAYYCKPKENAEIPTRGYIEILDKNDLSTYTEDPFASVFFDYGMNKLYLVFEGKEADIEVINSICFTFIFGHNVEASALDLSAFQGVKVYSQKEMSTEDGVQPTAENTCIVLCDTSSEEVSKKGLPMALFASLVSNNTWKNLQLKQFANFEPILTTKGEWENAREGGYTFIAKDETTITSPELIYFRAGNITIADIYIAEDLRQDIQVSMHNYIQNNNPPYTNSTIVSLTSVGNQIINSYITQGLISTATLTIPAVESQTSENIKKGYVANLKVEKTSAGAVWWVGGTITNNN